MDSAAFVVVVNGLIFLIVAFLLFAPIVKSSSKDFTSPAKQISMITLENTYLLFFL